MGSDTQLLPNVLIDIHYFYCFCVQVQDFTKAPDARQAWVGWFASICNDIPDDRFREFQAETFKFCMRYVQPEQPQQQQVPARQQQPYTAIQEVAGCTVSTLCAYCTDIFLACLCLYLPFLVFQLHFKLYCLNCGLTVAEEYFHIVQK